MSGASLAPLPYKPAGGPLSQSEADELLARGVTHEIVERLASDHAFYTFRAHPKQLRFLGSRARRRVMYGANRTGKSIIVHESAVEEAIGWSPSLTRATGKFVVYPRTQRIWVVSLDEDLSRDISEQMIDSFIPPEEKPFKGGDWSASDRIFTLRNGNTIGLKSCESGRDKFQGTSRHRIKFDEEPPEDVYKECVARVLDTGGGIDFAFTPMNGSIWLHKLITAPATFAQGVGMVDNPYLPPSALEEAKKEYSGDELLIRYYGMYILRIGAPFFAREDLDAQEERVRECEQRGVWVGRLRFA